MLTDLLAVLILLSLSRVELVLERVVPSLEIDSHLQRQWMG